MRVAFITTDSREHYKTYSAPQPSFGAAPTSVLESMAGMEDLEVHVICCARAVMRSPEKLAENIFFHSLYVPKLGWMSTGYQGCIRAVRRKLRGIQPDLVHGQGTELDCALDAVFSGYPNVVTLHGNMVELARMERGRPSSFHWLAARLETLALRRADGVLCNSRHTQNLAAGRSMRTWLVPNPLRPEYFDSPLTPPSKKPIFLNVGVACQNKQQLPLLEAAKVWHRSFPEIRMRFIGDVRPGKEYYSDRLLAELSNPEVVRFADHRPRQSLPELIKAYDEAIALVHTPQSEAFGLVVGEALARGLKLFGFRTGGMVDIAEEADGAVLVRPGDWDALNRAVLDWLARGCPAPRGNLELMASRYKPGRVTQKHIDIYREVLTNY